MKKKPEKEKKGNSESMCVRGQSSRIMDHKLVMPPSMPWYLECVVMYARYERRYLNGTWMEAKLLVELLMSRAVRLQNSQVPLDSVRVLGRRIKVLLEKATLYFCC